MAELWAVKEDPNSHGAGRLDTNIGDNSVRINGIPVCVVNDISLDIDGSLHIPTASKAATGSGTVRAYGQPIHRHNDLRDCGATTISVGQTTVRSD